MSSDHRRQRTASSDDGRCTGCGPRSRRGWAEHAAYADARGAALTRADARADRAARRASACSSSRAAPGGLGLAAAARVAPGGEVVLSDVAPEMTAIAAARAPSAVLDNVRTRELDLERDRRAGRRATTSCSAARD